MNFRLTQLAMLVMACVATPAFGQGFAPRPDFSLPGVSNVATSFPLPDHAAARLAQPFHSAADPDWKVIRLMAELSFLAYEDSFPTVQNRLRLYDLVLGEFVTVDNHHFITAWDKERDVLVVAFRGTDIAQLADVWTDLDYEKVTTNIGDVHKGFYDASEAMIRHVVAAIDHRRPRHVWLTGHSLGGAIATLAMRRLELSGRRVQGLVTFGQPRVGDYAFTESMNRGMGMRMLRVINEDDVVPSLPPRVPIVMPSYYSGGSVIQFLGGDLKRSAGLQVMARPPVDALDDLFAEPVAQPDADLHAPRMPDGEIPPEPEALTVEEFEQLKAILNELHTAPDEQLFGARPGAFMDRLNLLRRAANHPMHLYIRNIERFAVEDK